jgi:hypothetical protein
VHEGAVKLVVALKLFTKTLTASLELQPLTSVAVTEYNAAETGVIIGVKQLEQLNEEEEGLQVADEN